MELKIKMLAVLDAYSQVDDEIGYSCRECGYRWNPEAQHFPGVCSLGELRKEILQLWM